MTIEETRKKLDKLTEKFLNEMIESGEYDPDECIGVSSPPPEDEWVEPPTHDVFCECEECG